MLKISVQDMGESTSFKIEGRLTADVTSELEKCWEAALERQPVKPIVLELAAVTFVDSEAQGLVTRMRRLGVRLVPTGFLMNAMVDQIEAEITKEATRSPVFPGEKILHSTAHWGKN